MIPTQRLILTPSTVELAEAEIADRQEFARLLGAHVPAEWPPETLADALPIFLSLIKEHPDCLGWFGWYARTSGETSTLVGSCGFKGPPDDSATVEIGYSVLPQFHRLGYATEMVEGLIAWAQHANVRTIVAQTTDDNLGSRGVLAKLGFVAAGPGEEPGNTLYRRTISQGIGRDT